MPLLAGVVGEANAGDRFTRTVVLLGGLGVIFGISMSKEVDRRLSSVTAAASSASRTSACGTAPPCYVSGGYEVKEMLAVPVARMTGSTLGERSDQADTD